MLHEEYTFFLFHKTYMTIRLTTEDTAGAYSVIEMQHVPDVGPALHLHPRGCESYVVLAGSYTFTANEVETHLHPGQAIAIPANVPHRYRVGPEGGRLLVVCPPGLENYFWTVAQKSRDAVLTPEEEFAIAAQFGQDFLDTHPQMGQK